MEAESERVLELICPHDRLPLANREDGFHCPKCGRNYPREDGVTIVLDRPDDFYEGSFNNEVRFLPRSNNFLHRLPLWLITNGYLWQVTKTVKAGAQVLEMGCAGGIAWFGKRFSMTGVDVSLEGLKIAARKYDACVLARNLLAIPDRSVDAIVSSYFWEHMPHDTKGELLAEFMRVLKPGGKIVFVYDIATMNPLISWLRSTRPDLYQARFLDADGHVGYETADENDALFRAHGFRILRSNPMERTPLQSTSVYLKMREWPGAARQIGRLLSLLDRAPILHMYNGLLRAIDETVGRLFPRRWGRIMLTVAEKP